MWVNAQQNQPDDRKLFWAERIAGSWSLPAKIDDAVFTTEAVRAAALSNGDIVVGYRGTDGKGYTLRYSANNNPPWSPVIPIAENNNPDITSAPALSAAADGADAEAMYVSTAGSLHHVRLSGATWSAPQLVGSGTLVDVSLARAP